MGPVGKTRIFNRIADAFRVEAFAYLAEESDVQRMRFGLERIKYTYETGEKRSAITLQDGPVIDVALPLAELDARLNTPDLRGGAVIDLTSVTGQLAQHPDIRATGGIFVKDGKPARMRIFAYADKKSPESASFWTVDLPHIQIDSCAADGTGSFIYVKDHADLHAAMPFEDFKKCIAFARQKETGLLDLTQATKPRARRGLFPS